MTDEEDDPVTRVVIGATGIHISDRASGVYLPPLPVSRTEASRLEHESLVKLPIT